MFNKLVEYFDPLNPVGICVALAVCVVAWLLLTAWLGTTGLAAGAAGTAVVVRSLQKRAQDSSEPEDTQDAPEP